MMMMMITKKKKSKQKRPRPRPMIKWYHTRNQLNQVWDFSNMD